MFLYMDKNFKEFIFDIKFIIMCEPKVSFHNEVISATKCCSKSCEVLDYSLLHGEKQQEQQDEADCTAKQKLQKLIT